MKLVEAVLEPFRGIAVLGNAGKVLQMVGHMLMVGQALMDQ